MACNFRAAIKFITDPFITACWRVDYIRLVSEAYFNAEYLLATPAAAYSRIRLILLYSASAAYHMVLAKDRIIAFFRRLDHAMIFVLIAGTYTPFCLISLSGAAGWSLFCVINGLALVGIVYKLIWFHAPRWLSTILYIAMGWIVIIFSSPLTSIIGANGMLLLIFGGVIYTLGGLIYWLKPKWLEFKHVGFHEIFHVFILFGSLFHFLTIYGYVL